MKPSTTNTMYKNKLNALLMLVLLSGTLFMVGCGNDKDSAITVSKEEVAAEIAELKKIEKSEGYEAVKEKVKEELSNIGLGLNVLDELDEHEARLEQEETEAQETSEADSLASIKASKDLLTELKVLKERLDSNALIEDLGEALAKVRKAIDRVKEKQTKIDSKIEDKL